MERSIVIPAWNEERRLGPTLRHVLDWIAQDGVSTEVIVVDDGSRDATIQIARDHGVTVLPLAFHRGKGAAVRAGMWAATGERVLFCDADLSTPIEELPRLEAELAAGADVAIASRAAAGARIERRQPVWREGLGRVFNRYMRAVTALDEWQDTQCGFKLFTRPAVVQLFSQSFLDGFAFDVELLLRARAMGLRVAEVPVTWRDDPDSRVGLVRGAPRMAWDVLRLRWNRVGGG